MQGMPQEQAIVLLEDLDSLLDGELYLSSEVRRLRGELMNRERDARTVNAAQQELNQCRAKMAHLSVEVEAAKTETSVRADLCVAMNPFYHATILPWTNHPARAI